MTLTDYAAQHHITLLRDDLSYLRSRLESIPKAQRASLLKDYVQVWCHHRDSCNNAIRADNEGRCAANIWLRTVT